MSASNINIVSNIYIRKPESVDGTRDNLNLDPDFVAQVSGAKALAAVKKKSFGIISRIRLSDVQKRELDESTPCTYSLKGEIPFGIVMRDGVLQYECRCENTACKHYKSCNPKQFNRDVIVPIEDPITTQSTDIFTWVDFFENKAEAEERKQINSVPDDETVDIKEITKDTSEFIQIDSTQAISKIIESDIGSHILVNAGPGAGKTYTAIQRLLYVIGQVPSDECDRILVLCYTRAAVGEIKKRIEQGVINRTLPYEATDISVCTLDSFATSYLLTIDEISERLGEFDYNQRIQQFNQRIDAEDFEDFRYCIIDEMQDLVNDRATMTLKLLRALPCGYLLLGDKCQAIYDYDCQGSQNINSVKFYEALGKLLPEDTLKYEITGNKRQTEQLNHQSEILRHELLFLHPQTLRERFRESLTAMIKAPFFAESFREDDIHEPTAILCRNNGEAEYMSWLLHKNNISHNLIRTNSPKNTLRRCLADALWDYAEDTISAEDFKTRLIIRCKITEKDAETVFAAVSELLYNETRDYFECALLAKTVCKNIDLPDSLVNVNDSLLTVSTIHKAKGKEFEKVYLLGYSYDPRPESGSNTEEERVLYVAETRPKRAIELLRKRNVSKWYFRKNPRNRWIRTELIRNHRPHCAGFATGSEDDIDYSSFVQGELAEALERQEFISTQISAGDSVTLKLNEGRYDIICHNTVIGSMSDSYNRELQSTFNDNCRYVSQLPSVIDKLYIANVFTFVAYREYENIPAHFRRNRFWLAVEITGFGRTIWQENT